MITGREWNQICTALAAGGNISANGESYAPLKNVLRVLQAFAAEGCAVVVEKNGTWTVQWPREIARPLTDERQE